MENENNEHMAHYPIHTGILQPGWCSERIDKIAPAFLKAQMESKPAEKTAENPHLRSNYADLSSVVAACSDALHDNGIAYLQLLGNKDGRNTLKTILMHDSGQWFGDEAFLPEIEKKGGINAAQAEGSSISYKKRYGLQAATGVVVRGEDDDGNAAGHAGGQSAGQSAGQGAAQPKKDAAYWKAEASKNTAHVLNLKNWYKKHEAEIKKLTKAQQDDINLHVKTLREKLEKELEKKKAAEAAANTGTNSDASDLEKDLARGDGSGNPPEGSPQQPPDEISDIEPFNG